MSADTTSRDGVRRPIQRTFMLGSSVFVLVLASALAAIAYRTISSSIYDRYNDKLLDVISYVEDKADADDLARCIQSGTHSDAYDQLQLELNDVVDDFGLEYLYIVIPSPDIMTNVISATSAAEFAAGESNTPLLETTDAYSSEELARFLSYWDATDVSYFRESSTYGQYYTACKPLRDSSGTTIALICADLSIEELRHSLIRYFGGSILTVFALLTLFWLVARSWISRSVTRPLMELERSARQFASRSHDARDIRHMTLEVPQIHTGNEIEALSSALAKMANDIRTHVTQALDAQELAIVVERENVRLAEEAKSAAKIAELSESVTALFTNMPGPSFSKDSQTGIYLACNQAFAEYAHKDNPDGVVGLTDFEIFDPVTAQHFVDDDARCLSMDEPYVFFEDVFDAAGNPKQFQTTKMKFYDTQGRLCTLGLCVDVTDLMTARRETLDARRAYEEARDASITYYGIASALSADYRMLYYIDLETNHYTTYRHDGSQEDLSVILEGEDFFAEMRDRAANMLYTPDSEEVMRVFTKDNIIRTIDAQGTFAITYRLMQQGVPVWMTLKASRMADDERHLTVGISNVDAQMKQQEADKRLREEQATFSRIMGLSGDYLAVYAVNPDTGVYHELNEQQEYRDYVHLEGGQDFFADVVDKCRKVAHQDDLGILESLLVRERILSEVRSNGTFSMTFRMNMDGVPLYVNMRAALVEERDGPQLIVGLSNVDRQTKRDIELTLTRRRANKDSLTGVKNKHAYVDFNIQLDQRIEAHEDVEFGVVMCDLNDLKRTNDSLGHQAGDQLLRDACHIICNVFKHSPVFRIGGDEFAVIVEGYDFEHLDELCAKLAHIDEEHLRYGGPVVAWGASRYQDDASVAVVFDRADAAMYENKRALKQMG